MTGAAVAGEDLTKEQYEARKAELKEHLRAAQEDHAYTAYQLEMGGGDEAAVATVRESIATLNARLEGLEAAWVVAQGLARSKARDADKAARREARKRAEKHLAKRRELANSVLALIADAGRLWTEYRAEGERLLAAVRPFMPAGSPAEPGTFAALKTDAVFPYDWKREDWLLAGQVLAAGIDITITTGALDEVSERPFLHWFDIREAKIKDALEVMSPVTGER